MTAPIVLFVYNRPLHALQTLESLNKNRLADESELIIFSDGPKNTSTDKQLVAETRKVIRLKQWCAHIKIIEHNKNLGLATNIENGVTEVVNKYGRVIVLEDDLITSKGFLQYMNEALTLYENDEKVMHISGYMFPVKRKLPSTFFYNTASCWGWGTWKRAWDKYNPDARELYEQISPAAVEKFNIEGAYGFDKQLKANVEGTKKTWGVKWYASIFLNNGFSLHPYPSLVNNIGHDLTGENSVKTFRFNWGQLADTVEVKKIPIVESKKARKEMNLFYKRKISTLQKVKIHLSHKLRKNFSEDTLLLIRGLKNRKIRMLTSLKKAPRHTEMTTKIFGPEIKLGDSLSFYHLYKEIFVKELYKFKTDNEKPFIIDGGANIGMSCIYFKTLFPNARILAFEADIKIFELLKFNIESFNFKNIELHNLALWKEEGKLLFSSDGADGGKVTSNSEPTANLTQVKAIALKNYLNEPVDMLKLDIEGAETLVLESCKDLLHNVKNIFVEYHSFVNQPQSLGKILSILESNGFRYYIDNEGVFSTNPLFQINSYQNMDNQLNIFGSRE